MNCNYPLTFEPVLRRYLWGGRRLESLLGKSLGEGDDYAESWEIVDHGADQSVVAAGPLAGATLRQLVEQHADDLFGPHHPMDQFPLLLKFLDAQKDLSLQVHPNDAQAAQLDPPDLGKTEAWIVMHAEPGSLIYAGLKRGFDRRSVEQAIQNGTLELCLHRFEPQAGDCVFIPAGTPHALGAGLMIAEIQQASDTTFRLFDWNRVGKDGQPRPLHIEQGLDVLDFARGPVEPQQPQPTERSFAERLVACEKFVLDRWRVTEPQTLGGDGRFHIVAVLEGTATIESSVNAQPELLQCVRRKGETALVPAAAGSCTITPQGDVTLLDIYLPAAT